MNTETLNFETPDGATTAVVTLPADANGDSNAVVLIHEWWGINAHIRDLASRYARAGYICVAPDLFRGQTTTDQQQASKLMHNLALDDGIAIINQSIEASRAKYGVEKFAVTGYCMGGTFALRAACLNPKLAAAAAFYGDLPEDEVLAQLKIPTIFFAGARDNWITPEKVEQLEDAARTHGLPLEAVSYDADHAFFNDTRPEVYNPEAAADAWQRTLKLFGEMLGSKQAQ
ncbi:MAG: carboxymethylenebutenolidase [Blastocatellia bacterium]|jgi:carboxymethylenebutenolidase|nr:carboxymethylenebutenolidase [Blastocatellia bacterium]